MHVNILDFTGRLLWDVACRRAGPTDSLAMGPDLLRRTKGRWTTRDVESGCLAPSGADYPPKNMIKSMGKWPKVGGQVVMHGRESAV
jgi:hypothetical protein